MPNNTHSAELWYRRFHLCDEKHNKFWEIHLFADKVVTIYGRIGSIGTMTTKPFGGLFEAIRFFHDIIKKKSDKGYQEVKLH